MARTDTEENKVIGGLRGNQGALVVQAEVLRGKLQQRKCDDDMPVRPAPEGGISMFWRVFGGTILSIIVLVCITICNQFSGSLSDLRRDLNAQIEARSELVRKVDLDRTVATFWTDLKENRIASNALDGLTDKAKSLEQQFDRQTKAAGDDRKDLMARIDDNRKSLQEEGRDTAKKVEDLRKTIDEERKDYQRKLEEQRKAADDERKDMARKFEEKLKWYEDQHKELSGKLQSMAERLAAVETLQNQGKAVAPAATPKK